MKISVIGAAGMVGSDIAKEAARRGHDVHTYTRSGSLEGSTALDFADTAAVKGVIDSSDFTVISVASRDNYDAAIQAHAALINTAPTGRFLVVGGAGALNAGEGRLYDSPEFPAEYLPEAQAFGKVYDDYVARAGDLQWTMLAPAPLIAPGEVRGHVLGLDAPVGDSVATGDFAVAVLDEAESPAHTGRRFTVASK